MDETRYQMESTSLRSAKIDDIELKPTKGDNKLTRKILRAQIVENPRIKENTVKISIIHQRRATESDNWEDISDSGLNLLKAKECAKLILDTNQTRQLLNHLMNMYQIGEGGIRKGTTILEIANQDEVIKADGPRAKLIKKLLEGNYGEEFWNALIENTPDLAEKLTFAKIYAVREKSVHEFEEKILLNKDENYWRQFLKRNTWIFGTFFVRIINERRIDIKNETDFSLEAEEGFMDIVEIKKPDINFWLMYSKSNKYYLYRDKYLLPNYELQGAIAQVSKYILQAEKQVSNMDYIETHSGLVPLKPRGLIVIGRSNNWGKKEKEAFRLMNDSLHNIEILTFDHLLNRAKRILEVFKKENEEISENDTTS